MTSLIKYLKECCDRDTNIFIEKAQIIQPHQRKFTMYGKDQDGIRNDGKIHLKG